MDFAKRVHSALFFWVTILHPQGRSTLHTRNWLIIAASGVESAVSGFRSLTERHGVASG
jgi:hypothetical protein